METRYFRISPGRYVRQAMSIWIGQWWWAALTPLAALAVCGLYDPLCYVAAVFVALVVYPGLMMVIYYNYALRPEAALSIIPHRIVIDDAGVVITYQESEEYRTPKPRTIPNAEIESIEDTGSTMIVHLKSGKYDFIEIPTAEIIAKD